MGLHWEVRESWSFLVDIQKGGKLFVVEDCITHEELVRVVADDFSLDNQEDLLELSYSLPASILSQMPEDTPPMFIANDRQVHSFIELCKSHVLRLCVSYKQEFQKAEDHMDGVEMEDGKDDVDLNDDGVDLDDDKDDVDRGFDYVIGADDDGYDDDDDDDGMSDTANDEVYSDGEDFSIYGKVKGEDEDGDEDDGVMISKGKSYTLYCVDNVHVNQRYSSKNELALEMRKLAIMQNFAFKLGKSTKTLFVAVCRVSGCKWRLRATTISKDSETFWVKKYLKVHTCPTAERFAASKRCAPRYIARMFLDHFKIIDGVTAKQIKDSMKEAYGIKMDYNAAYSALMYAQKIVRGTHEDGYEKLPEYLHLIKKANPGTVTGLEVDNDDRFKYMFIAFGASIAGFEFLRRVVVVDGSHLTGRYKGVMLVATAQDGNFQIYPLAIGIVDSENDDAWAWFFAKLRSCISGDHPLVIVSDRNKSIARACTKIFPNAHRGICNYHLQNNIITKFKGKDIMYLVKGAAYAYTISEFNRYMEEIRRQNSKLADYLVKADVRLWTRVHFPGDRYNIKTSNIAESVNALLKVARGFPISFLLEFIRERLGRWFFKRRENTIELQTQHSRRVEFLMYTRGLSAARLNVQQVDVSQFYVTGGSQDCVVDLGRLKCGCCVFDIEKIPCEHAIAAATSIGMHVSSSVEPTYTKGFLYAAYSGNIFSTMDCIQAPDEVLAIKCLPPLVRRPPGRQRKSRYKTLLEVAVRSRVKPRKVHKSYTCSKCNQSGHNRSTCVS